MRKYIAMLNRMSEGAFCMLSGTLKTCCAMVFCGFMLILHIGEAVPGNLPLYSMAMEMTFSPAGILLVGGLLSVILEDLSRRG